MPAARSLNRPSAPGAAVVVSSTYEDLLRDVRSALFTGRANIEYAWLMMFHDVGRFIHTHLLGHQDRADFAAKTIARLAADTDVSRRVLYEWLQFFRCFPIVRARN
ncbi:MAG: hypothetical protein HY736_24760 [Verrucomicrobia bacterium]|nr:hypothetical protein [Verrucomicrobiota bacterium]